MQKPAHITFFKRISVFSEKKENGLFTSSYEELTCRARHKQIIYLYFQNLTTTPFERPLSRTTLSNFFFPILSQKELFKLVIKSPV